MPTKRKSIIRMGAAREQQVLLQAGLKDEARAKAAKIKAKKAIAQSKKDAAKAKKLMVRAKKLESTRAVKFIRKTAGKVQSTKAGAKLRKKVLKTGRKIKRIIKRK